VILTARYVKKARRPCACDCCGRRIFGPHLYLYGAADLADKPSAMRLHRECADWSHPKIAKVLAGEGENHA
jgi:hypothetical protein